MPEPIKLKEYFGVNLAKLLSEKIKTVHPDFPSDIFIKKIKHECSKLELKDRVNLICRELKNCLPENYPQAAKILDKVYGPENPNETGMFKFYYWLMPIAKYIEDYGLDHFEISIDSIYELTKRNTGEYTVRPFINKYPAKSLKIFSKWADDKNFHVRRLASEGLRPKLPWAKKLELFLNEPEPVFQILEKLKQDKVLFVKKSVANNLNDYLKESYIKTISLLEKWSKTNNINTQWIIKHALRNQIKTGNKDAINLIKNFR